LPAQSIATDPDLCRRTALEGFPSFLYHSTRLALIIAEYTADGLTSSIRDIENIRSNTACLLALPQGQYVIFAKPDCYVRQAPYIQSSPLVADHLSTDSMDHLRLGDASVTAHAQDQRLAATRLSIAP
jgi:hypothetical protein